MGAFLDAKNYIFSERGARRRPGMYEYAGGNTVDYPPVRHVLPYWKTDGTVETLVVDEKFLYVATNSSLTGKYWTYSTGTIGVSGTTVTGSGTTWTGQSLQEGDVMVLDADGSGDGPEEVIVDSIDSNTQITLKSTPTGTYAAGTDYEIRRAFSADGIVDWAYVVTNTVVFADGSRPLYGYDGSSFGAYDASLTFIPSVVEFHRDRLYAANTEESSTQYPQRIRWSLITDKTDFIGTPDVQYVDRPYGSEPIRRLLGLGANLIVYYKDRIEIGIPTNSPSDSLPLGYDTIETGRIGLVGPRAVTRWIDAHYFVGQDDIYRLSIDGSLDRIGAPVVRSTIHESSYLENVYVTPDPQNESILFGFPGNGESMTKLWRFNVRTGSWAPDTVTCSCISLASAAEETTWSGMAGTWEAAGGSWGAQGVPPLGMRVYVGSGGDHVWYYTTDVDRDPDLAAIEGLLETGDIDLEHPDEYKTYMRWSIRTDEVVDSDVLFRVSVSTDGGSTWSSLGTMTIGEGEREAVLDFLVTDSAARFRFFSSTAVTPYVISELVLKVVLRGMEYEE
jgi:hypothetical protein